MRFEYLVLEVGEIPPKPAADPPWAGLNIRFADGTEKFANNFEKILNAYGSEGWELVTDSPLEWHKEKISQETMADVCRLIFKRAIKE